MSLLEPGLMGFYQPLPEAPEERDRYSEEFDDLIDRYARKMGFSKKHFEAFAKHINNLHQAGKHAEGDAVHGMVLSLNDNPRFQPERFKTAAHKGMDLSGKSQYCESCGSGSAKYSLIADPQAEGGRTLYAKAGSVKDAKDQSHMAQTFTNMAGHSNPDIRSGRLAEVRSHADKAVAAGNKSQQAIYHHMHASEGHYAIATHPTTSVDDIHKHYRAMLEHDRALTQHRLVLGHEI